MKITSLVDTAGFLLPCAKYIRESGHEIEFVKREDAGLCNFMKHYNEPGFEPDSVDHFRIRCIHAAQEADIVHVSYSHKLVHIIKERYPEKKVVYQIHGGEARSRPIEVEAAIELADLTLFTTTDIPNYVQGHDMHHLPHAVDTEHFKGRKLGYKSVCMLYPRKAERDVVKKHLEGQADIDFVYLYTMPFSDVPEFLSQYNTFYDVKCNNETKEIIEPVPEHDIMSRMAEEALCMGLTVINARFARARGLPERYRAEVVTEQLLEFYNAI